MTGATQEIRSAQRRHALTGPWTADGAHVLEAGAVVATCRTAADARLIVDMHQWFGKLVNVVVMIKRQERDCKQMGTDIAAELAVEQRLRLIEDGDDA